MRSNLILRAILSVVCNIGFSQVEVTTEKLFRLNGLEGVRTIGDQTFVSELPQLTTQAVAIVKVDTEAANVEVTASDQSRIPVDCKEIAKGIYLLEGTGKIWIEVSVIDFMKNIYARRIATVELSPPLPPPPAPSSCDDKTNGNFNGLAKRACEWVSDVKREAQSKRSELSQVYLDASEKLESGQFLTINAATGAVSTQWAQVLNTDELKQAWAGWSARANEELSKQWNSQTTNTDKRAMMVRFLEALGMGLK